MNSQNSPPTETPDQTEVDRTQLGWGFWALWVTALTVVGALSCRMGAAAATAELALAPAALLIFGILAGVVQWFALRRHGPPVHWWILASSLAGLLADCVSYITMFLGVVATQSSVGLLAGLACAWAVYGAVFGVLLLRVFPGRGALFASLAGWATAGIVGGVVAWARDVILVTPTTFVPYPSISLTSSMGDIVVVGAVYGATGAVITGTALVWLMRQPALPREDAERRAKDARRVIVAGVITGLIAALLCSYLTPLLLWLRAGFGLDADFFLAAVADSVLCIPAMALLSIPLALGCGYAGLAIGRARRKPSAKPWIWGGASVGAVAGYVLGSLLIAAVFGL